MPKQQKKIKNINCKGCNKAIKRTKAYYRNGDYYCNKKCFKTKGVKKEENK